MADPRKTTITNRLPLTGASTGAPLAPLRPGMPALDTIHSTIPFAPKRGASYRIIRTTETDSYEKSPAALRIPKLLRTKGAPPSAPLQAAVAAQPPAGDNFQGTARKRKPIQRNSRI